MSVYKLDAVMEWKVETALGKKRKGTGPRSVQVMEGTLFLSLNIVTATSYF